MNGFRLRHDEHGAGKGSFTSDQGALIQANWTFTCVEWGGQPQEQFLAVFVDQVGSSFINGGVDFTVRFQQTAPVWISDIEGSASMSRFHQVTGHEGNGEVTKDLDSEIQDEIVQLSYLRDQFSELERIVVTKEEELTKKLGWVQSKKSLKDCDSLKCIFQTAYSQLYEKAKITYCAFAENGRGSRCHGFYPPWGPPSGHRNRTYRNITHPHPPPHHRPPFHPPSFCKCLPPPPPDPEKNYPPPPPALFQPPLPYHGPERHPPPPPPPFHPPASPDMGSKYPMWLLEDDDDHLLYPALPSHSDHGWSGKRLSKEPKKHHPPPLPLPGNEHRPRNGSGDSHHGPPIFSLKDFFADPVLAPLRILASVIVLVLIIIALHTRFFARGGSREQRRHHCSLGRRGTCQNLFHRVAFWRNNSAAVLPREREETFRERYMDDTEILSTTMEEEISQFRTAASVVGDMVAAEEGYSQAFNQVSEIRPFIRKQSFPNQDATPGEMQESIQNGLVAIPLPFGSQARVPTDVQVNTAQLSGTHQYMPSFGVGSSCSSTEPIVSAFSTRNQSLTTLPNPPVNTTAFPDFVPADDDVYSLPAYDFENEPMGSHVVADGMMFDQSRGGYTPGSSNFLPGSLGSADAFGDAK